jgi:hypothetical protein
MSNIQNRLEELQPYVIGLRYFQGLPVVDVIFKEKWVVPNNEIISKEKGEGDENYYMFFSQQEGVGIDELLDHAESIIHLNVEKEKKNELFKVKVNELKKLFQTNPLTKLEKMKFVLGSTPITTDFDPEEINLDDEVEVPLPEPKEEVKEEPILEPVDAEVEAFNNSDGGQKVRINNTNIELPPKPTNGKKIELEDHSIKTDDGPCTHGPESFCNKCMDNH